MLNLFRKLFGIDKPKPSSATSAAQGPAFTPPKQSLDEAVRGLGSSDAQARREALMCLGKLKTAAARTVPSISQLAANDPDPTVRDTALTAVLQIVSAGLNDKAIPGHVRENLATMLANIKDPRAAEALTSALAGELPFGDGYLVWKLIDALAMHSDQRAIPVIEQAIQKSEVNNGERGRAAIKKIKGTFSEADALLEQLVAAWAKNQNYQPFLDKLKVVGESTCVIQLAARLSGYVLAGKSSWVDEAASILAQFGAPALAPLRSIQREGGNASANDMIRWAISRIESAQNPTP